MDQDMAKSSGMTETGPLRRRRLLLRGDRPRLSISRVFHSGWARSRGRMFQAKGFPS